MELNAEEMDQIEAYWKGTCSTEEKAQIEARMQSDLDYREEVELFRDLFLVIEKSGDIALEQYLDQVREQAEKREQTPPSIENPAPSVTENPSIKKPKNKRRYLWPLVAAAAVVGGIIIFWQWSRDVKLDEKFYANLNEAYQRSGKKTFPLPSLGQGYVPKDPEYDSLLQNINAAFKAGNVNEVLRVGSLFKQKHPNLKEFFADYPLAHAYYATGNWSEAIQLLRIHGNDPDLEKSQETEWLLVLALGHTTRYRKEATQRLDAILANPKHQRHLEAKQLKPSWRD